MKKFYAKVSMTVLGLMAWSQVQGADYVVDFTIDGVNYEKISDTEVRIVKADEFGKKHYGGDFVIPDEVTQDGKTYKVTSLGDFALRSSEITSLKIGANLKVIADNAFKNCKQLVTVEMTDNTTSIGEDAFSDCVALQTVKMSKGLVSLGKSAFYEDAALTSIELPDGLEKIDEYTFCNCKSLKSVSLGNGVKAIMKNSFDLCEALESISLPASVESIGTSAFYRSGLKSIYVAGKPVCEERNSSSGIRVTPFSSKGGTSEFDLFSTCTLFVPKGKIDEYKALDIWKEFAKIEEYDPSTGIKSQAAARAEESARFTLNGQQVRTAKKGINIIRMSDGSVRKEIVK